MVINIVVLLIKNNLRKLLDFAKSNRVLSIVAILGFVVLSWIFLRPGQLLSIDLLAIFAIGASLRRRQDFEHLQALTKYPRSVLCGWYILMSTPLLALNLASDTTTTLVFTVGLVLFVLGYPTRKWSAGSSLEIIPRPIVLALSSIPLEWRSGLRKRWRALIMFFVFGCLLAFRGHYLTPNVVVIVALVSMYLLTRIACGFYAVCESSIMIQAFNGKGKAFMRQKVIQAVSTLFLLLIPVLVLGLSLVVAEWRLLLVGVFVAELLIINAALVKYAYYIEGEDRWIVQEAGLLTGMIAIVLLPIFPFVESQLIKRALYRLNKLI
jgi:hypothetical protein